jgi:hypothetical protein
VIESVLGGEHEQVGDVVDRARPRLAVAAVVVTDAAREQVINAIDNDDARVEDGAVAGDGAELDHRPIAQTLGGDGCPAAGRRFAHVGNLCRTDRTKKVIA